MPIPTPHDVFELSMADGAIVRIRRHGNVAGPRLVMSHGNGFAIDGYFPFWRLLLDAFDVVVYDQRNHGRNPRHVAGGHSIAQMAHDAAAVHAGIVAAFGAKATAGIFHSLSAIAGILANTLHGVVWDALVLVDPALVPPEGHPLHEPTRKFENVLARWARERPDRFADPSELAAQFRAARASALWLPESPDPMARAVTQPLPDGTFELTCPREFEARIYEQNIDIGAWALLPKLHGPVLFLGADPAMPNATPPARTGQLAAATLGLNHVIISEAGHMMQIERPAACIDALREFFRARRFA